MLRESAEDFKSNTAHARHAARVADVCAASNPRFDRVRFMRAAMPRWQAGTRHESVWERQTRKGDR